MKNAYEVLYKKETDLARVREEIESLKIAASLLGEEDLSFFQPGAEVEAKKGVENVTAQPEELQSTGTEASAGTQPRSGFWGSLKRRRQ